MMRFDIVTIFPAMVEHAIAAGIVGRAVERGTVSVVVHDLRAYTTDRHRVVDDVPYGGGPGMVLKAEPICRALDAIRAADDRVPRVVLTSPQGSLFTQEAAERLSRAGRMALICGRYEGVDERIRTLVDEELSAGDYVLSGGELPALMIVDAVARQVPGVVGDARSVAEDSFSRGLLDCPHYTRPSELRLSGAVLTVPSVLLSGDHSAIRRWRKREAIQRTMARRPELLERALLDEEEQAILHELRDARHEDRVGSVGPNHGRSQGNGRD